MFTRVYQTLRDTGTLPGVHIVAKRDVNEGIDEEKDIFQMVQNSPRASTRRNTRRLRVPHTSVWKTLHAEGTYSYHVQPVQHLGPGDFAERLEFCKWFNGSRELHRYILFTDESQFNHDGGNNTHISHMWADENPHATVESNFQQVLVSMCGVQSGRSADWSFYLGRSPYRRDVPQISAGGIAPTYGGCAFK